MHAAPLSNTAPLALPSPVLIVEDEPPLQERLCAILCKLGYERADLRVAGSLAQAQTCLAQFPPALAMIDLMLPDGNSLPLIGQLRAAHPELGILVISAWSSEDVILNALRAGATGYVLKERDDIEVSLSIRSVLRGGAPIDPFIARRILGLLSLPIPTDTKAEAPAVLARTQADRLSNREHQILGLVTDGLSNREIAEQLFLSRYTVESHVKSIYRKLAVSSRTMAVRAARERGVLT